MPSIPTRVLVASLMVGAAGLPIAVGQEAGKAALPGAPASAPAPAPKACDRDPLPYAPHRAKP